MKTQEIDKQEVLGKFVDQNVYYCVSGLIYHLFSEDANREKYFDEFPHLMQGPPSLWEGELTCPQCDQVWLGQIEEFSDYYQCPNCGFENVICSKDNFDPIEYQEIFEHWIVSDWLADKLIAHGESVEKDFYGLTVWGRTCTGQSIMLDSVIEDIYDEIHK